MAQEVELPAGAKAPGFDHGAMQLPEGAVIAPDQTPDPKPLSISKEDLTKRLDELKKAEAQITANLQAIGGAIQDCEYWLKEIEYRDAEANKKQNEPKRKQLPEKK
jgi:hypothetical protein